MHKWGWFSGRQRYRCLACRRTFSDLTGTPAAYTKLIELWPEYVECMRGALPLRYCAARLKTSLSTAFRWRHAVLNASRAADDTTLSGRIEVNELWMAHSKKGSRRLDRPPRARGARERDPLLFDTRRVCVVVTCDQDKRTYSQHIDARHLQAEDLCGVLSARLRKPVKIVSARGPRSVHVSLASAAAGVYEWALRATHEKLAGVIAFQKRIRRFLVPFRGVATKHLDNYLRWHRVLEMLCV